VIGEITMAKHRAPRYVRSKRALARVPVAAGATVVGIGVLSSPAQAATTTATTHDWTGVAQCESSGNWSINTGNGYFGGLQFSQATWAGFGGANFAPRADLATSAQQVTIAEKVLAQQGIGAWPVCGKHLTGGTTATAAKAPAPTPAPKPAPKPAPAVKRSSPAPATTPAPRAHAAGRHAAPAADYTVTGGDTLSKIAGAHNEPWRDLYQRNVGVIGSNPDLIFPGQVLVTSGPKHAAPAAAAPAPAVKRAVAAAPAAAPAIGAAHITNSAGSVKPQVQAAANAVVARVPGVAGLTIGGTRADAIDPNGHPAGRALDYMVGSNAALGGAVVQYHVAHWADLGVEYIIWQQKILTSPTGSWMLMENRGSATANHMDHVHVNYRAA
jgi:LysM repeat protein